MRNKNASLQVYGYFYKAVVQAVLLFGSESRNLTSTLLMGLEGFHIQCGYQMVQMHMWKHDPTITWVYPASSDILTECGLQNIKEYVRR